MGRIHAAFVFGAAIASLLAQLVPVFGEEKDSASVLITTADGRSVSGETEITSVKVESSFGALEIRLENLASIGLAGDTATFIARDGAAIRGKLLTDPWKIKTSTGDTTVKVAEMARILVQAVRRSPASPPSKSTAPPVPSGGEAGKPAQEADPDRTKPLAALGLQSVIYNLQLTPDKKKLCALNVAGNKILIVDTAAFSIEREISVPTGTCVIAISPDGKTIFAAGKKTVRLVNPADGETTSSFDIEYDIYDIVVGDDKTLYASTSEDLAIISVPKRAVTRTLFAVMGVMQLTPDRKKLYTCAGSVTLDKPLEDLSFVCHGQGFREDFHISSDGRYGVSVAGEVFRLAKSAAADMIEFAKVDRHLSCAFVASGRRVLLFTAAGFIKEHHGDTFELVKSHSFGYKVYSVVVDGAAGVMYTLACPMPPGDSRGFDDPRVAPVVDIYKFELPK